MLKIVAGITSCQVSKVAFLRSAGRLYGFAGGGSETDLVIERLGFSDLYAASEDRGA